ncbi:UDP-N-acetylmuramate--L-alanine ligase [Alphaproteobacteria bacterium]|nr:UDP-N-acetylmuramate--L-alanine ligase [Alphaproteobacteria bacterium]
MKRFPIESGVIHFVGIGGIGMSGIADILVNLGYRVSGSDLKENAMTARLSRKGVKIMTGHLEDNVRDASVVVISSAISKDNPEILEARRLHIPVIRRAEMLAELMKMKISVAVAGTHGKTTTTSLVAAILEQASLDPTVVNGGVINAYNSNARLGSGDYIVVEADESDGSFTKLMSTVAVVTNINFDHTDNFENFDELRGMFEKFVGNIPFYGAAVLCVAHPEVRKISESIVDRRIIKYGFESDADVSCANVVLSSQGAEFDVVFSTSISDRYGVNGGWKGVRLPMFGRHNVQNALAAISVGLEFGISEENMRMALGSFMGVKRRFTRVAEVDGVVIIDDYAHHPVEIGAVLTAAKSVCTGKIYAVMQPHRYTRLTTFLPEFAKVLELSDTVFIAPVYSAGEQYKDIDHFSLLKELKENNVVRAEFVQDVWELKDKISPMLNQRDAGSDQCDIGSDNNETHVLQAPLDIGRLCERSSEDFVIFLGAGDITQWAYTFADIMKD